MYYYDLFMMVKVRSLLATVAHCSKVLTIPFYGMSVFGGSKSFVSSLRARQHELMEVDKNAGIVEYSTSLNTR